jgi:PleD family two-component response regulator
MTGSITQLLTDIPALFSDSKLFVAAAASESQSSSSDIKAAPRNGLVIDDEKSIADSLTEILVAVGYNALAFYNGHAAIEFARKKCPDVVLSDVVMPKLNLAPAGHISEIPYSITVHCRRQVDVG